MGRGAKAGKRKPIQKEMRRMSEEAKQVSKELEGTFIRRVHGKQKWYSTNDAELVRNEKCKV